MAGFGRFKLTDALPEPQPLDDELQSSALPGTSPGAKAKGKKKAKTKLSPAAGTEAEPTARERMVDIGRGNQQAGRQRSSGK